MIASGARSARRSGTATTSARSRSSTTARGPRRSRPRPPLKCYGITSWEFRPLVEENAEHRLEDAADDGEEATRVRAARRLAARRARRGRPRPARDRRSARASRRPGSASTTSAEDGAAHAFLRADPDDLADGLAFAARAVDRPLAGDDEVGAARCVAEADPLENELRRRSTSSPPSDAIAAPSPPAAPAPARSAYGRSCSSAPRAGLRAASTCSGEAPFWGPKARAAPRSPSSGLRTSHSAVELAAGEPSPTTSRRPGAAVDRRRVAETDEDRAARLRGGRQQELAEPAARRAHRVELLLREPRAGRRPRPPHTTAVPSSSTRKRAATGRPSGSDADAVRHSPPTRRGEHLRRSLSAVGDRQPRPPRGRRRAVPAARASAASTADRTPLQLAGDASARTGRLLDGLAPPARPAVRPPPGPRPACASASRTKGPRGPGR